VYIACTDRLGSAVVEVPAAVLHMCASHSRSAVVDTHVTITVMLLLLLLSLVCSCLGVYTHEGTAKTAHLAAAARQTLSLRSISGNSRLES
jgi:hypothetical protein